MSKKDYIAVAMIIKARIEYINSQYSNNIGLVEHDARIQESKSYASNLANMFSQDNPKFDQNRFYSACGIE